MYLEQIVHGRPRTVVSVALSFAFVMLQCCPSAKTAGREDAQSSIKSAVSLTAQTVLLIDYIRNGQATDAFAKGQISFLADEARRSADELRELRPAPAAQSSIHECRVQLELLRGELSSLQAAINDPGALTTAKRRIAAIRTSLEKAKSL